MAWARAERAAASICCSICAWLSASFTSTVWNPAAGAAAGVSTALAGLQFEVEVQHRGRADQGQVLRGPATKPNISA